VGTEQRYRPRERRIAWLALWLVLSGPAAAQGGGCAPPPSWSEANAGHGQPVAEVGECLRARAWEARNLNVPVNSAVAGIVAQCKVRVVFSEGAAGSPSRARAQQQVGVHDRQAQDEALADVTWVRRCAGR